MAQLIISDRTPDRAGFRLDDAPVLLSDDGPRRLADGERVDPGAVVLRPVRIEEDRPAVWCLSFPHGRLGVHVNGQPRTIGVYVLGDLDRLRVDGTFAGHFDARETVTPRPFAAADGEVRCARCFDPLTPGQTCVTCSTCAATYHYGDGDADDCCWRCVATCRVCGAATALDAAPVPPEVLA